MKNTFNIIALNIVSLVCIGIAACLAICDKPGWGWFLFVGVIFTHIKISE